MTATRGLEVLGHGLELVAATQSPRGSRHDRDVVDPWYRRARGMTVRWESGHEDAILLSSREL